MSTPPRLTRRATTSKLCPGTGAASVGGGANAANGPVGSGVSTGWASALSSRPSAALIASVNCRSLMRIRCAASGSAAASASASRVAASPRARAGTHAEGSAAVKAAVAAPTSASTRRSVSTAPAGAGRPSIPNRPGTLVSMPSKKLVSLSGAGTALATRW